MSQQLLTRSTTSDLPTSLDSTASKLVYLYLDVAGESTVTDMESSLDMQKISLYPLLKSLSKKDLVVRDGETYRLA